MEIWSVLRAKLYILKTSGNVSFNTFLTVNIFSTCSQNIIHYNSIYNHYKSKSDFIHLRLYCEDLRFTVDTVTLTKAEMTLSRDPDVLSITLLGSNLQQQDIFIMVCKIRQRRQDTFQEF